MRLYNGTSWQFCWLNEADQQEYHEVFNTQALALPPEGSKEKQDKVYRALLHRCESVELRFRERTSFDTINKSNCG